MSRLSDYIAQVAGIPDAPTDGQTYGRRGQDLSWQTVYTIAEADLVYAPVVHTHGYVSLTANETVAGEKEFLDRAAFDGASINPAYGLNVGGSINVGAGQNYYINGSPIESFVDAPSDGNIYGRQNAGWVQIDAGGGGTISNLSMSYFSTYATIVNSGGQDTNINAATTSLAGLMTAADKTKLNSALESGDVNLGNNRGSTYVAITNSGGGDTTISAATASLAGVMTAADKQKLDGSLADGDVDLGTLYADTSITITNTAGNNAILDAATDRDAGLLSTDMYDWLAAAQSDRIIGVQHAYTNVTMVKVNDPLSGTIDVTIQGATSGQAGVMTGPDKAKLDGLALVAVSMVNDLYNRSQITLTERDDALDLLT